MSVPVTVPEKFYLFGGRLSQTGSVNGAFFGNLVSVRRRRGAILSTIWIQPLTWLGQSSHNPDYSCGYV
jgi:hypothetical protein